LLAKGMRRAGIVLSALALVTIGLLAAAPLRAAAPDRLVSLSISLWPEYDRPGVLYIYRGELPAGTALPAQVTFRLPKQPSSTAGIDEQGQFRYIQPTLEPDGDGYLVTYEIAWPRFQLEYYDDTLTLQGAGRVLDFAYRADYAVEQMVLEVKEPYGASDFTLEPAADTRSQAGDGLTEHRRTVGVVAPGQEVSWRVTYNKSDSRSSAEALGLPTPETLPYEPAAGQTVLRPNRSWVPWVVGGLAGATVAVVLYLALQRSSRPAADLAPAAEPRRRSSRAKGKRRGKGPQVAPAKYCFQCGAAMNRDDAFCRQCGARRRGV
jgi:hypothetical protein